MNKAELISRIAKKSKQTQAVSNAVLDATLEAITEALAEGETVTLVGLGIFTPKRKNERMGRNPKTGEPALSLPKIPCLSSLAKLQKMH